MITYTKAAAAELRGKIADRLTKALAEDPDNRHLQRQTQRLYMAKISTVHGFCSDILREYVYRLDLPSDFRIAEDNECREIRERVLDQLLEDAYEHIGEEDAFRTLVDTQGLGRTDALVPQIIEQVYDKAQCHPEPEVWLDACLAQCEEKDRPEDTVWGKFLLDDARYWLDRELEALERCAKEAAAVDGWEKVTALLNATVLSLRQVRDCPDWDGFARGIADLNYGRLTFPKKGGDPDLAESIKAIRTACKEKTEALTKAVLRQRGNRAGGAFPDGSGGQGPYRSGAAVREKLRPGQETPPHCGFWGPGTLCSGIAAGQKPFRSHGGGQRDRQPVPGNSRGRISGFQRRAGCDFCGADRAKT